MRMRTPALMALALSATALGGCASIVDGSTQTLSVQTIGNNGAAVDDAHCTLVNTKGTFFVTTPGTVAVHRDSANLNVKCAKEGMAPGLASVVSSTKGMAFGNILAGGIIGAAVDMGTGAAYDYPALITVQMGTSSTIGGRQKRASGTDGTPGVPDAGESVSAARAD